MGYGHRAAGCDLLFEQRNHAAVGTQYVTETHRHEFCLIMSVESLHDHLTDTLAGAHDIGGIYRLVGGDHDKFFCTVLGSRHGGLPGAEHIVLHSLVRAVFHQRHMLVGCGMIYDIRLMGFKNRIDPVGIADTADEHHQI